MGKTLSPHFLLPQKLTIFGPGFLNRQSKKLHKKEKKARLFIFLGKLERCFLTADDVHYQLHRTPSVGLFKTEAVRGPGRQQKHIIFLKNSKVAKTCPISCFLGKRTL